MIFSKRAVSIFNGQAQGYFLRRVFLRTKNSYWFQFQSKGNRQTVQNSITKNIMPTFARFLHFPCQIVKTKTGKPRPRKNKGMKMKRHLPYIYAGNIEKYGAKLFKS